MNMDISTLCLIPSFKCHSGCLYLWLQSSFWTKTTALIDSAPYSPPLTTYFQHTDHQYSFHTLVFLNWWCLEWQMTLPLSALQINYRNTTAGHFFATTLKCYLHCRSRKTICVKIGTELKDRQIFDTAGLSGVGACHVVFTAIHSCTCQNFNWGRHPYRY